MLCTICHQPELQIAPDGRIADSIRPNAQQKKETLQFLCSRCTLVASQKMAEPPWDMNLEEFLLACRQKRVPSKMIRNIKMRRTK
jgi:hypothetical protein